MRIFLLFSLITLVACHFTKELSSKSENCYPAVNASELDVSNIDSTNNNCNFSLLENSNNRLQLILNYSGGCENHEFHLVRSHNGSEDGLHVFDLVHNTKGDGCREWITDTICFDLSSMKMKKGDRFKMKGLESEQIVD